MWLRHYVDLTLVLTLLILAHQVAQMVPTKILEPIDAMHAKVLASLAQVGPHARLVIQTLVLCSEISVTTTVSGMTRMPTELFNHTLVQTIPLVIKLVRMAHTFLLFFAKPAHRNVKPAWKQERIAQGAPVAFIYKTEYVCVNAQPVSNQ